MKSKVRKSQLTHLLLTNSTFELSRAQKDGQSTSHQSSFGGLNTPENIAAREPSDFDIAFITPDEAQTRWGDRILSIEGNTVSQSSIIHQFDRLINFFHLDLIQ